MNRIQNPLWFCQQTNHNNFVILKIFSLLFSKMIQFMSLERSQISRVNLFNRTTLFPDHNDHHLEVYLFMSSSFYSFHQTHNNFWLWTIWFMISSQIYIFLFPSLFSYYETRENFQHITQYFPYFYSRMTDVQSCFSCCLQ